MAALVVFVAVLAVYMQALGGPFLWDDRLLILDASLVEKGGSLSDFLNAPFWAAGSFHGASTSYYRPLVTLSFALDSVLHGENPGGYHLTNLVFHVTNALLLHALVKKVGASRWTAALLAAGWALLPRLAEAAAWISGRTDLLATAFTFGALLAWGPGIGRRIASALLLGVGLLAKESAGAGALALFASAWVAAEPLPANKRLSRVLSELTPLLVVLVGYATLRVSAVGFKDEAEDFGFVNRARAVLEALGTYAAMLVDAWRPRAVIGRIGATSFAGHAAGLAVVVGLVALWRRRSHFSPHSALGLALFFGALFPVVHIVPIPLLTLTADRFLYLPTAGLVLAYAPALDRWLGMSRPRWLVAVAFASSLAVVTFRRVGVWSDEVDFWVETYVETPRTNNAAANELANVYYRAGLLEDALELSERALRYDDPHRATAQYNTGLCLARLGRYDEARAALGQLRGRGRFAGDVELQLAILEVRAGNFEKARRVLLPLARAGNSVMGMFIRKLPELEQAYRELATLDEKSPPERRARLATLVDNEAVATRAWLELLGSPDVPKAGAESALKFFLERADRQALADAARAYRARFGGMEPKLGAMIDVHLAEIDRLVQARPRVGLSTPEKTGEKPDPSR